MSMSLLFAKQQAIRAPINPMDKCTIVSILPKHIHEVHHTIQPGVFDIEPGSMENPAILVVGTSSWWREVDANQPLLEITNSSLQVADAVIKCYCNGYIGCNMGDTMPGLFYVMGEHKIDDIKKKFGKELIAASIKQKNWFTVLVKQADIMWSRSNGNPLAVSDDARMAARQLGLTTKEWLRDAHMIQLIPCKACGNMNRDTSVVCPNCKVVLNFEKFKELNLQFATDAPRA